MAWRSALSRNLQELRIHLSATSPASQGTRDFLAGSLADLKKANPGFPLLVREADGATAAAIARYDFGAEASAPLDGLDAAAVDAALAGLVKKGEAMPRSTESKGDLPK